jgi:hypothetical protein
MKINRVFLTLTITGLTLLSGNLFGQENVEMSQSERQVYDSVQTARHEQQLVTAQRAVDADKMSDAKAAEKETKAIAKETRRIDREASSAAREAKMAVRAEKKAQKARKDADKQARKADKAKHTSDKN